jgi:hypothetical protein
MSDSEPMKPWYILLITILLSNCDEYRNKIRLSLYA